MWITAKKLADKYGVTESNVRVFTHNNRDNHRIIKKDVLYVYYNDAELQNIADKRARLWNQCHKAYYLLLEFGYKESDICKGLADKYNERQGLWISYINNSMWARIDEISVLKLHISTRMEKFHRWCYEELKKFEKEYTIA